MCLMFTWCYVKSNGNTNSSSQDLGQTPVNNGMRFELARILNRSDDGCQPKLYNALQDQIRGVNNNPTAYEYKDHIADLIDKKCVRSYVPYFYSKRLRMCHELFEYYKDFDKLIKLNP